MEPEQKTNGNGAVVGLIIIVVILIIGGIYLWKTGIKEQAAPVSSDSTENLEADVNSIELDSLDEGI